MIRLPKGELGLIHEEWHGWTIGKDGYLWSPEGRHFDTGELRDLQYQGTRIRALEKRVRELELATSLELFKDKIMSVDLKY